MMHPWLHSYVAYQSTQNGHGDDEDEDEEEEGHTQWPQPPPRSIHEPLCAFRARLFFCRVLFEVARPDCRLPRGLLGTNLVASPVASVAVSLVVLPLLGEERREHALAYQGLLAGRPKSLPSRAPTPTRDLE